MSLSPYSLYVPAVDGVAVGLSGGVDSAVAALGLVEAGLRVVGVTARTCAGSVEEAAAVESARRVARTLGIEHRVVDGTERFREVVLAEALRTARRGGTPSVCPACNAGLKLAVLAEVADELGLSHLATGHYARLGRDGAEVELLRGEDRRRDQSYFLAAVPLTLLRRLLLPLGGAEKERVRAEARRAGLAAAERPASMDLCPALDGPLMAALEREGSPWLAAGPIVDHHDRELGVHRGLFRYTLGQRRSLGLGGGSGEPLFVIGKRRRSNTLVVGPEELLWRSEIEVELADTGAPPPGGRLKCQPRRNHPGALAEVFPAGEGRVGVRFLTPQRALTPGQFAVFYRSTERGEAVSGAGVIWEVREP